MPLVTINNEETYLIGDPHLGKDFLNGVPLNRRGERELHQRKTFLQELSAPERHPGLKTVIIMGDLFDKFKISNNVLVQTYEALQYAAHNFPKVNYLILMGNHDISRNTELVSSFDILALMFEEYSNVYFIKENTWFRTSGIMNNLYLLCPYSAFKTAEESILATKDYVQIDRGMVTTPLQCQAVFGHWDVESFGGEGHNLLPYKFLAKITKEIYTGHIHTPDMFKIDHEGNKSVHATTATVTVVGSMLPYSHGEDPQGNFYVTKTLEEYNLAIKNDPDAFKDKALRLLLKPDEVQPEEISALQISYKYVDAQQVEQVEVSIEDFSFEKIFNEVMVENEVPEGLVTQTWGRYKELNTDDTEA